MVDVISGEVTAAGNGTVQLRINGILVTYPEITALNPENIIRIEYHDSPGARYGDASVVIDYITRKKESGGNIRGGAFHSIGGGRTSIDDMLSARYTYGKSEFRQTPALSSAKVTGYVNMMKNSSSPTTNYTARK